MVPLKSELASAPQRLDTCAVPNVIEDFQVRLRNEEFMDSSVRCVFDDVR